MGKAILPLRLEEREVLERHLKVDSYAFGGKKICLGDYPTYFCESDKFGLYEVSLLNHHAIVDSRGDRDLAKKVILHFKNIIVEQEKRRVH